MLSQLVRDRHAGFCCYSTRHLAVTWCVARRVARADRSAALCAADVLIPLVVVSLWPYHLPTVLVANCSSGAHPRCATILVIPK